MLNKRGALIAYTITILSGGLYVSASADFIGGGYYNYCCPSFLPLLYRNVLYSVGIGGMVIGPYFGIAALSVKSGESVWARANVLIHRHISVPFIGAFALSWGALFPGGFGSSGYQGMVIIPYTVFVLLGTLVTYMGTRDTGVITTNPANP